MNQKIKEILQKCNDAYSNGEFYTLDIEDVMILDNLLDIIVTPDEVSDQIYDMIYYTAKDKWPNDEFFNKLTSENTGYGQDIIHEIPMGSMEELKEGDFEKWSKGHEQFLVSDKLDGCSLILTYIDGYLRIAATRGHGTKGKDVMRHIECVPNIPKKINVPGKLIVRGELLFKKNRINSILTDIEERTGKKQKNGRNTIAGALNAKETNKYLFDNTHFVAYWTSDKQGLAFDNLKQYGFEVPFYHILSRETLTDENMIDLIQTRLKFSDYELDGIILTQMDNIEEGFVGGTINPKCSRKFKIGIYDNIAESTVKHINWQISRWGVFTPVLEIEPVEIAGALITNITAHNYENVIKSKCGVGAKIKFKRAGLVIPKLEEVLVPSEDYELPKCKTEVCGVDLQYIWTDDSHEYYREMCIRKLEYFGQKLEIDMLGYGNCAKIYDAYENNQSLNIGDYPERLYELTENDFVNLIGKNGKKIYDSLVAKKSTFTEVKFAAACGSLGPDIGERVLQLVWDKYGTLENMTEDMLKSIDGFGQARIEQYIEYQHFWYMTKVHMQLHGYGIEFVDAKKKTESDKFKDYVVCFTGVRDKALAQYIIDNGGQAGDNWTKNTNCLIVKDKNSTSTKMKKALQLGIKILSLDEAYEEFDYHGL